jgi:hypothetical protein
MNAIDKEEGHDCWIVMDQDRIEILGYVYESGALVRPNGTVEFYPSADAAYAAI